MSLGPILYVDDEEDYQILVKRILNRAGLEVVIAETGAQGMTCLMHERPSLLILDINLPDTDGYRFCQDLRQDPAWIDLPILMLTVHRRPEEWLHGFSSGANDYISKPLNPPELVERVRTSMTGKTRPFAEKETPEYRLIQAAVMGNRSAFEILIQKYQERLIESLRYMVRSDVQVEDVVSEAFIIAFKKLGEFRGEASFYTWVYRIALNESIGIYRRPRSVVSMRQLTEPPLENIVLERESNRMVLEALERVREPYREILEMFFLQDLSYEIIAQKLHIPEGTVMSRLHKARKLLQESWPGEKRDPARAFLQ